jgi:5-formyltetrahydrofolate cyclo-ligase
MSHAGNLNHRVGGTVQGTDRGDQPAGVQQSTGSHLPGTKSVNTRRASGPAEGDFVLERAGPTGTKAALRAQLLAARGALTDDQRTAAGRQLRDAVLAAPETQMAGTVAAYISVGTEPDTRGLVFALWKRGTYVLLPLLRPDRDLDWASYEGPDSLAAGPHGLLEPTEPPRGVSAITSADLVLVPALAADRGGNRLGRGGGSYDRALARVGPAVLTVALLYDGELLDKVPAGVHDQPVRCVAIPSKGMIRLG